MSIANELNYLHGTKEAIRQAIIDKDVNVAAEDTFRSYADKIRQIEGGGSGESVKINFNNYTDGESYLPYNENFIVIQPNNEETIYLRDHLIWEWNNTIYVGFGLLLTTSFGNNKVYKYDKNTLEYIGSFTAGTLGFVARNSNVYVYNNKAFLTTGNTYPLNSSTGTGNSVLRILDLETETMTNGVTMPPVATSTYVSIFNGKWLFQIDNPYVGTAAVTSSYLIDLDNPTARFTITTGNAQAKAIDYNDEYIYWAGGGNGNSVVKLHLETRTLTTLPALPTAQNMMKILSNDNYFWVFGGFGTNANERQLIQYNITTNERIIVDLDYDICEPLSRQITFYTKVKNNLYFRGMDNNYQSNVLMIDTSEDDWYKNKKGFIYSPIYLGKYVGCNGYSLFSGLWLTDDNILYSTNVGVGTSYTAACGALFAITDINKYITLNTPPGTKISVDGGAEFSPTSSTTRVKSPFTGYVKYGGSGGGEEEITETFYVDITWAGVNEIKVSGSAKTITAKIFDLTDTEILDYDNYTFEWTNDMTSAQLSGTTITYPNPNQIRILAESSAIIHTTFNLTLHIKDKNTGEEHKDTQEFDIVDLW